MRIGVPKEIKTQEFRVGMTPSGVATLAARGHQVLVEQGAGLGSSIPDEAFGLHEDWDRAFLSQYCSGDFTQFDPHDPHQTPTDETALGQLHDRHLTTLAQRALRELDTLPPLTGSD